MTPQRRDRREEIGQQPAQLRAERVGAELLLRRSVARGDDVVRVHFDRGNAEGRGHGPPPVRLHPERIEVRHDQSCPDAPGERRHLAARIAAQKDEADGQVSKSPLGFREPAEHERVLAQRGAQEGRREAEGRHQGRFAGQRLPLRVDERPVVGGALVAAHPVDDRSRCRGHALVQRVEALGSDGRRHGYFANSRMRLFMSGADSHLIVYVSAAALATWTSFFSMPPSSQT